MGTVAARCAASARRHEKTGAGVPVSVAMACSNWTRCLRSTSTCVSVLSSSACCCATSRPEAAPRSWRAVARLERTSLQVDRAREDVELDVGLAQVEVGGREIRRSAAGGVLEVGGGLLGGCLAPCDRALQPPEDIRFVVDAEQH